MKNDGCLLNDTVKKYANDKPIFKLNSNMPVKCTINKQKRTALRLTVAIRVTE